jgi:spoIIIJ-associated protein
VEAANERSVVASGKTVDDAIRNGLLMLRVRPEEVNIEILSEGSRGILGLGAENARVRLRVKATPIQPESQAVAPQSAPPPKSRGKGEGFKHRPEKQGVQAAPTMASTRDAPQTEPASDQSTPEWLGKHFLSETLSRMGIRASVEVLRHDELSEEGEEPPIVLNIRGDDLGILIGRRGETLRALQYLIRLMVSHRLKQWSDLIVDVENYRVRRRQALENLAQLMAERVVKEGRPQALEPMPAYERRIVHMALRKHPKVTTSSIGEGERRKVTIVPRRQGQDGR